MVGLLRSVYDFLETRTVTSSPEKLAARARRLYSVGKKIQKFRLRRTVRYAYERSPFYHRFFDKIGLKPSDVRTAEDLPKIPLTTAHHLSSDPYQFLAVPKNQIFQIATSAGTTGKPKMVFSTKREVDREALAASVGFKLLGVHRRDVVQVMFHFGGISWLTGFAVIRSFEKLRLLVIPAGTYPTPEEQIRSIQEHGVTILTGTPSFMHMLTVEGQKYAELDELGVKRIFLTGETWPESLRKKLRDAWNCPLVYDQYGLTEIGGVAFECSMFNGLHLNELGVYTEIIDPKTGEVLEGEEEGELVFTPLDREGTPLLRYRSGDISRFISEPCECGRRTRRIARVKGRTDDMIKLGAADTFFPSMIDSVVFEIPGVVEYELAITKDGHKDVLTFRLEVESSKENILNQLRASLFKIQDMRYNIQVTKIIAEPVVEIVLPDSLKRDKIKVRRIVDLREK